MAAAAWLRHGQVCRPFGGQQRRIGVIGSVEINDDPPRFVGRRNLFGVMIKIVVHKAFELPFALRHIFRKPADDMTRSADIFNALDPAIDNPGLCCFDHIIDHHADLLADELRNQFIRRVIWIARQDSLPTIRDERQFA